MCILCEFPERVVVLKGTKDKVLRDAETMTDIFGDMKTIYTEDELRIFRTGGRYTRAMAEKMMAAVAEIATQSRKRHPSGIRLLSPQDLPNTFLFRHALCAYLLHVR
jgi:hypothetical protein